MTVLETAAQSILPPAPGAIRPPDPPLTPHLARRIARDFTPRWDDTWGGTCMLHSQQPEPNAVRLDGNDYLGLTGHPAIVAAQMAALRQDSFVIQLGAFLQSSHPAHALELALAHWLGKEDGIICQSGYAANTGLIQAIADAQTPVYVDALAHTSLWEGVHAARATARGW